MPDILLDQPIAGGPCSGPQILGNQCGILAALLWVPKSAVTSKKHRYPLVRAFEWGAFAITTVYKVQPLSRTSIVRFSAVGFDSTTPLSGGDFYTITLETSPTGVTWTVVATLTVNASATDVTSVPSSVIECSPGSWIRVRAVSTGAPQAFVHIKIDHEEEHS